ncbi:MAG: hypothetical protein ABSG16_12490, partial [Candidatus Acidiferrum sp.]
MPWRDASHESPGAVAGATAAARDAAKAPAKDALKAANDTPKVADDVRKDTPAITINPHRGLKMDVDLALINAT